MCQDSGNRAQAQARRRKKGAPARAIASDGKADAAGVSRLGKSRASASAKAQKRRAGAKKARRRMRLQVTSKPTPQMRKISKKTSRSRARINPAGQIMRMQARRCGYFGLLPEALFDDARNARISVACVPRHGLCGVGRVNVEVIFLLRHRRVAGDRFCISKLIFGIDGISGGH